jgi:hypothetical protein
MIGRGQDLGRENRDRPGWEQMRVGADEEGIEGVCGILIKKKYTGPLSLCLSSNLRSNALSDGTTVLL